MHDIGVSNRRTATSATKFRASGNPGGTSPAGAARSVKPMACGDSTDGASPSSVRDRTGDYLVQSLAPSAHTLPSSRDCDLGGVLAAVVHG